MKLLIITQKINSEDPLLGFFHRWVEALFQPGDQLTVICLEQGKHNLAKEIKVLSLGKEGGVSRIKYLFRFFRYLRQERGNYDTVFVHMNQEYVLLAAWLWRLWGKRIFLWRNHPSGNWLTRLAVAWSHQVFCTSEQSYTYRFAKTVLMPVGIDTEVFKKTGEDKQAGSLLFLGRLSPIKRPELFLQALGKLKEENFPFRASIVGPSSDSTQTYRQSLKKLAQGLGLGEAVSFYQAVAPQETVKWYHRHEVLVNLTPAGSLDKTIFEAMACEELVLISNPALQALVHEKLFCEEDRPEALAQKIKAVLNLKPEEKEDLASRGRQTVIEKHDLRQLVRLLRRYFEYA